MISFKTTKYCGEESPFAAKKYDIYILQCTKLKIGCLICKYRVFSLKIHIQGKIQVIQSQPQWLAFFIFFENFSENSAKSGFVW